jgi:hypothetical protein
MASLAMMVVSSIYYLFSGDGFSAVNTDAPSHWLIMTGAQWFFLAVGLGIASLVLRICSSSALKSEKKTAEEARKREQAANEKKRAEENYAQRQATLKNSINAANTRAARALDRLPGRLEAAQDHLQQAEVDWRERVFNPFWTSIESCAVELAKFRKDIEDIGSCAAEYDAAVKEYDSVPPAFSVTTISVTAMASYNSLNDAMAKFTRRAQGDRDFANIFELWRGNAIMENGFANLRSAIQQMSSNISSQISSLGSRIDSINDSLERQSDRVSHAIEHQTSMSSYHQTELTQSLKESRRHEKIIADRLYNIERGYKPVF